MEVGAAIVNKLSHRELFILISAIILAIIYYVPRIRWKKGKIYLFDPKYEDQRRDMKMLLEKYDAQQQEMIKQFFAINERLRGLSIEILKCNIYNEKLPLKDRLCSAVRYIKAGYNSETKSYIESTLATDYPKEWAICWDIIQEPNL